MKKFKMLMMAVLTILSVSAFAQASANNQKKITKQKSETVKYTCPMQAVVEMGNLNLSSKEKMKREVMKIHAGQTNNGATTGMPCCLSKAATTLNLSPKEKMKREAMKIYNSPMNPDLNSGKPMASTCPMMTISTSDKKVSCFSCSSKLNLSLKEQMKRDIMKI